MKLMVFFSLLVGLVSADYVVDLSDELDEIFGPDRNTEQAKILHEIFAPDLNTEQAKPLDEIFGPDRNTEQAKILHEIFAPDLNTEQAKPLDEIFGPDTEQDKLLDEIFDTDTEQDIPNALKSGGQPPVTENSFDYLNKWSTWNSKALKSKTNPILKQTKASVTEIPDELSTARLELLRLQQEIAMKEHYFVREEHELKMTHLINEENRKQELHNLNLRSMPQNDVL